MIACPACGIENDERLDECRKCHALLRGAGDEASSSAFGGVCPRCDSYNDPGVEVCESCGETLSNETEGVAAPSSAAPAPASKPCAACRAENPGAAKFCFNCGKPFPAAPVPDALEELEDTSVFEEVRPPFPVSLVVEQGNLKGATFELASLESRVGAQASHVQLDDAFVAPHAATLLFLDDRLVLRDEGSANGVFVKVRESAPLEPFDHFVVGDRLLRYEGAIDLTGSAGEDGTPILGGPRPQGRLFRVREVLANGRSGRVVHRPGPVLRIGRGAACELRFASDEQLPDVAAEIHFDPQGAARLIDPGQGSPGAWLRLRRQRTFELQSGDRLQVGAQRLRVEFA